MNTMRSVRLHGIGALSIDEIPIPTPGPGELLMRVKANGVCATDARKYHVGVNDGNYPFNSGHEWVGEVIDAGEKVTGWLGGSLAYGDTYGGYAEFATIAVDPTPWSAGPIRIPRSMPLERSVFIEPLADCLHAVIDQARVAPEERVVVIGAGSMGLQTVAAAKRLGARIAVVERLENRAELAHSFGAEFAAAGEDPWRDVRDWTDGSGADVVLLMVGSPRLVEQAITLCRNGGRVVLFAGFGDRGRTEVDLNEIHYREIALIGSEWIGAPPNQRRDRYEDALAWLEEGSLTLETLVTDQIGFEGVEGCFRGWDSPKGVKTVFYPDIAS